MSADWSDGGLGNADSPEIREPPLSIVRWLERVRPVEGSMRRGVGITLEAGLTVSSTKATCPMRMN
jgi:hypothetical protein